MKRITLAIATLLVAASVWAQCGHERWPIKVGTDPEASSIDIANPIDTTIGELRALVPPADIRHFNGRAPAELQVYTLLITMTLFKSEGDSDLHLVIRDRGETMIAESVDPKCAVGSPWLDDMKAVRQAFRDRFGGAKAKRNLHVRVRITGPAFFDFIHGQTGHAANGIEIHPILGIEFLN